VSRFSDRLRTARNTRGWTQKELAELSGLTPSAIGNYESGQRAQASASAMLKLAEVLGVSPGWLAQGDSPAPPPPAPWPFPSVPYSRYLQLKPQQRRQLEALIGAYIDSCSG
ncbi:putative transcriptional regulator, partial [Bordetella avium 197N]